MSRVVILGSVFLPAAVFDPLVEELGRLGHEAVVAVAERVDSPVDVLDAYATVVERHRGDVVVAHSNAGHYVPALTTAGHVDAAVFLDAVVPDPAGGRRPVVPATLRAALIDLAGAGTLPPWTDWWPLEDARALFPDDATFTAVRAATPRVPLSYVDGSVDVPSGWVSGLAAAFLAFGSTYAEELRLAGALGWPTRTLPLGHLGFLQDPAAVARALEDLLTTRTPGSN